jgi:GntR family transcriptional regulator, arabinose operon transcriptional repressor
MSRAKASRRAVSREPALKPAVLSRFPGKLRSEQLHDYLAEQLKSLSPGDKLPSERALAKESGLSLLTVNKVLATLAAEGLVERRTGRGTYVSEARKNAARTATGLKMVRFVTRHPEQVLKPSHDTYVAAYYRGVREAAAKDGVEVLPTPFIVDENGLERLPADAFDSPSVHGVIFVESGSPDYRQLWKFLNEDKRIVAFDHMAPERGLSSVMFDNAGAIVTAVEHCYKHGHRRIGYLGPANSIGQPAEERLAGFRQALEKFSLDPAQCPIVIEAGEAIKPPVKRLLAQPAGDRPTAFVAFMDSELADTAEVAEQLSLQIPRDLSLAGFGDSMSREGYTRLKLDSVAFDEAEMGRMAYNLWKSGAKGLVKRLSGKMVVRGSVAPPAH